MISSQELDHLRARGFSLEQIPDEHDPISYQLALRDLTDAKLLPLSVDFLSPQTLHRLRHGLSKNQPLPRALGLRSLKASEAPSVIDATAGLGVDAFFMAALGCRVRGIERSPVVGELLRDGYRRLKIAAQSLEDQALSEISQRLSFEIGDACLIFKALKPEHRPDVIYLDPMYPEEGRSESALPKKAMQMFRKIIGEDQDARQLFELARAVAQRRVVVKRPLHAPPIADKPSHSFNGKTARFDMYLSQ